MVPGPRRNIRDTSVRLRGGAWTARERLRYKQLLKWSAAVLAADIATFSWTFSELYAAFDERGEPRNLFISSLGLLFLRWQSTQQRQVTLAPTLRLNRTINSFSDEECRLYFRFSKQDLRRVLAVLQLEDSLICENRCRFSTEEALLITLRRLGTPTRLSDLVALFGRDHTQLSRVCNTMVSLIYDRWHHLLQHRLHRWVPDFERFCTAVQAKTGIAAGDLIIGFVDGTFRPNCKPGGHDDIQREVFSGHKRQHGLKFQGVMLPNGMLADVHGPYSGIRCYSLASAISSIVFSLCVSSTLHIPCV
jgi:hypothetical protein